MHNNPVLEGHLKDFQKVMTCLERVPEERRREAAEMLDGLAREIRFQLGSPSLAPAEVVDKIRALFSSAVEMMNSSADSRVRRIADKISERAAKLSRLRRSDALPDSLLHSPA